MCHCDGICRAVTHTAKEDTHAGIVQSVCLNASGRVHAFWPKTGSFKPSLAISSGGIESVHSQLCSHKVWAESVDSRFSEFWCSILVSVKIGHPTFSVNLVSFRFVYLICSVWTCLAARFVFGTFPCLGVLLRVLYDFCGEDRFQSFFCFRNLDFRGLVSSKRPGS